MTAAQGRSIRDRLLVGRPVLNRVDEFRGDETRVARYWADPSATVLVLHGDDVELAGSAQTPTLHLAPTNTLGSVRPESAFLLGLDGNAPVFGIVDDTTDHSDPGAGAPRSRASLRQVGTSLSARDAELITTTMALGNWHRTHPCCSRCGSPTLIEQAGWVRRCPVDDSQHFPRTDPAIIVLAIDSFSRMLLGRRVGWDRTWFSTLAGFVEPGESAESAVVREIAEEVGVDVDPTTVQFMGSQPWPFPSSLMLGFHAFGRSNQEPVPDGEEIVEARWFTRDQLFAACESGEVKIPPRLSIARHLIEAWYGEELPGEWSR